MENSSGQFYGEQAMNTAKKRGSTTVPIAVSRCGYNSASKGNSLTSLMKALLRLKELYKLWSVSRARPAGVWNFPVMIRQI